MASWNLHRVVKSMLAHVQIETQARNVIRYTVSSIQLRIDSNQPEIEPKIVGNSFIISTNISVFFFYTELNVLMQLKCNRRRISMEWMPGVKHLHF